MMKPSDVITLFIALYGAILSTAIFWREQQKDRRTLRVSCRISFGISARGTTTGQHYLSIEAVNNGHRPITITQVGLLTNTKEICIPVMSDPNFYPIPKKLEDGESVMVHMDWNDITNADPRLKDKKAYYIKAFVEDAEGEKYFASLPKVLKELGIAK